MSTIDSKIIESIRNGRDDQALAYLYDKPLKKIRQYILNNNGSREDAKDIFQDAVIILFNQVMKNKYDERYDVDGFLYSVARNLWINKSKRDKRILSKDFISENAAIDSSDLLKDLITKEKLEALAKVFEKLDERCRTLLHYAIYEKLSMKEISKRMGLANENAAKSSHYRCKTYLARIVKSDSTILNLLKN